MGKNYYPESVKKYKAKAYKQIKVEYPRDFVEKWEVAIKEDGITKAEFIRRAIKEYLQSKPE